MSIEKHGAGWRWGLDIDMKNTGERRTARLCTITYAALSFELRYFSAEGEAAGRIASRLSTFGGLAWCFGPLYSPFPSRDPELAI